MKLSADLKAFEGRIGYKFVKPELLNRAVTHASMSSANRDDNQRLEFLGDRVLGLVMSEALLALDPGATEGQLAPRFNAIWGLSLNWGGPKCCLVAAASKPCWATQSRQ